MERVCSKIIVNNLKLILIYVLLDLFKLVQSDHWNCDVVAKRSLQGYYGNYTLNVKAKDLGTPSNIAEAQLEISILDFNDHAPYFVSPMNNVTIRVPEVTNHYHSNVYLIFNFFLWS